MLRPTIAIRSPGCQSGTVECYPIGLGMRLGEGPSACTTAAMGTRPVPSTLPVPRISSYIVACTPVFWTMFALAGINSCPLREAAYLTAVLHDCVIGKTCQARDDAGPLKVQLRMMRTLSRLVIVGTNPRVRASHIG